MLLGALAGVVELADTQDLGSCAFERGGSNPPFRTGYRTGNVHPADDLFA